MTSEFDLIGHIRSRVRTRDNVVLGIGDDAALLRVPPGHDLVVAMDTMNVGVHFPPDTDAASIGWKALAVNLSDLAAMGAQPTWCTLSLSLPESNAAWLDGFLDGFLALATQHDCALVGGDTTRGPLSICVTVHGLVPHGTALRRSGAQVGDDVWVTGTLGDAAVALAEWQRQSREALLHHSREDGNAGATALRHSLERANPASSSTLRHRLDRPTPRVEIGLALRNVATACIDLSDGLVQDLGHLLAASRVGALLDVGAIPGTAPRDARLAGGDDYELCFTAPPAHRDHLAALATRIGHIDAQPGLRLNDATPPPRGWDHFR